MHGTDPIPEAVEDEVLRIVELPAPERAEQLEAICARHPQVAAAIRTWIGAALGTRTEVEAAGTAARTDAGVAEEPGEALPTIDGYRVVRRLGQGGYGSVYLAEQEQPVRRSVAIKVIKRGMDTSAVLRRFREERQTLARMEHDAIARIYDAGSTVDGLPYLAMELIDGLPLRAFCDRQRLSIAARLELFQRVCEGVAHAHQKGIIHRDLKPGNVLVAMSAGRAVPKIIDFGIARAVEREPAAFELTHVGMILGTPAYMSPEQAAGAHGDVDTRTDVYALGVMLYELLTGDLPIRWKTLQSATTEAILHMIREREPERPSARVTRERSPEAAAARGFATPQRHARALAGDLDRITLKALAKERQLRYASPLDLAADLHRHLHHEPVTAGSPGTAYRMRKFVRRYRLQVGAAAMLLLVVVAGALVSTALWFRSETNLARFNQMADVHVLQSLVAESDQLWPEIPDRVAAMDDWLVRARELRDRLPAHRRTASDMLAAWYPGVLAPAGLAVLPPAATRSEIERRFLITSLSRLVEDLAAFVDPSGGMLGDVERRRAWAADLPRRTLEQPAAAWAVACASIGDPAQCPRYGGLRIAPQLGLIPIGRDPGSGLWEFADPRTGSVPDRGAHGQLRIGEEIGLVFVLLPGGTFRMGAQSHTPDGERYDSRAKPQEGPVHEVALAPFFLSKYEMTQGQWLRLTGANPSEGQGPREEQGEQFEFSLRHPVESVSWSVCDLWLRRLRFALPTEAQWEYACRAGSDTVFATGDSPATLRGSANVADKSLAQFETSPGMDTESDGFPCHAPVGSFRGNGFGLFDMHGNVAEWCADSQLDYATHPAGAGDGFRGFAGDRRVYRGGWWRDGAHLARSSWRDNDRVSYEDWTLGVRPARALDPAPFDGPVTGSSRPAPTTR